MIMRFLQYLHDEDEDGYTLDSMLGHNGWNPVDEQDGGEERDALRELWGRPFYEVKVEGTFDTVTGRITYTHFEGREIAQ